MKKADFDAWYDALPPEAQKAVDEFEVLLSECSRCQGGEVHRSNSEGDEWFEDCPHCNGGSRSITEEDRARMRVVIEEEFAWLLAGEAV